jgi:hypothetical protein
LRIAEKLAGVTSIPVSCCKLFWSGNRWPMQDFHLRGKRMPGSIGSEAVLGILWVQLMLWKSSCSDGCKHGSCHTSATNITWVPH